MRYVLMSVCVCMVRVEAEGTVALRREEKREKKRKRKKRAKKREGRKEGRKDLFVCESRKKNRRTVESMMNGDDGKNGTDVMLQEYDDGW